MNSLYLPARDWHLIVWGVGVTGRHHVFGMNDGRVLWKWGKGQKQYFMKVAMSFCHIL